MKETYFPEKIENTTLEKLRSKLLGGIQADLQTIAFPYEFPLTVEITDSLVKYILLGDMEDSKKNSVISLDNFEKYLSQNFDISPLTLLDNTDDTDTVTRFIDSNGKLAFNAIQAGAGGAVVHDESLLGQGLVNNPLKINNLQYTVKALKEGDNITINQDPDNVGTWIISSSGGGGGGTVVTDNTLTGTGVTTDPLGINTAIYKVAQLTGGSNIAITETAAGSKNWKIDFIGGQGWMTEVIHDATLSGKGITGSPLTVLSGGSWDKIAGYTRTSTDNKNKYLINGYFGSGNDTYFNIDFDYKTSTDSGVTWVQTSKISIGTDNRDSKGIVGSVAAYGKNNALVRQLDSHSLDTGAQVPSWSDFDSTHFSLVNNKITVIGGGRTLKGHNGVLVNDSIETEYLVGLGTWFYQQLPTEGDAYNSIIDFRNSKNFPSTIILYNETTTQIPELINSVKVDSSSIVFKGYETAVDSHLVCNYNNVDCNIFTIEGDILVSDRNRQGFKRAIGIGEDTLTITKDFIDLFPFAEAENPIHRMLSGKKIQHDYDVPCWGDFSDAFELDDGKITLSNELEWEKYWTPQEGVGETTYYSKIGVNPDKADNFMSFFVEYWKLGDSTPQSSINIKTEHSPHYDKYGTSIECINFNEDGGLGRKKQLDAYKLESDEQVLSVDDMYKDDFNLMAYNRDKNVIAINRNKWQVQQLYAGEGIELMEINGRWRISCKNPSPEKYGYILNNNNKGILCNGKRMRNTDVIDLMKEIANLKEEIKCLKKAISL